MTTPAAALETTAAETSADKIKFRENLAFFLANLGNVPIQVTISSFLLIFYTDVAGLNPAAVGTMFLISKIFDGINDPIVGYIIDHLPPTRWGRFRPWLVVGSILTALNLVALWMGPGLATTGKLFIAYLTYILIGITFDVMDIAKNSLMPVMTTSNKERNTLAALGGISAVIGLTLVNVAVLPIVGLFADPEQGWYAAVIGIAAIVIVLSVLGAWGVRERVLPERPESYPLRELGGMLVQSRPLMVLYGASLLMMCAFATRNGALVFYVTYNLGDANLMGPAAISMMVGMILGSVIDNIANDRIIDAIEDFGDQEHGPHRSRVKSRDIGVEDQQKAADGHLNGDVAQVCQKEGQVFGKFDPVRRSLSSGSFQGSGGCGHQISLTFLLLQNLILQSDSTGDVHLEASAPEGRDGFIGRAGVGDYAGDLADSRVGGDRQAAKFRAVHNDID